METDKIKSEFANNQPDQLTIKEAESYETKANEGERELGGIIGGALLGGMATLGIAGVTVGALVGFGIVKIAKVIERQVHCS